MGGISGVSCAPERVFPGQSKCAREEGRRIGGKGEAAIPLQVHLSRAAPRRTGSLSGAGAPAPAPFGEALARAERAHLERALEDARAAAQRLRRSFTLENFRLFQGAVQAFLRSVTEQRYVTEHRWSSGRRYSIIQEVRAELARLEEEFLSGHREEMLWLRRLEAIEGMILDLYA